MQILKRKTKSQMLAEAFRYAIDYFKNYLENQNEDPKQVENISLDPTPILQNKNTYTEKQSLLQKFEDSKIKSAKSQKNSLFTPLINEK